VTAPYVKRRDITVAEERQEAGYDSFYNEPFVTSTWTASLRGSLSTGETVALERTGSTFAEALQNLEQAIAELGWEVKG
jgi:hypothetical protein